jgi:tRNA(Ile)-lysidine synthase
VIGRAEAARYFSGLENLPAIILAVSGGPDSTALLILAARWRAARKRGPKLHAVTIDHGLRPEAAQEARAVARLARQCAIPHTTLRWTGQKPHAGLQEAARLARYRLLVAFASKTGAVAILTAHTLDDQAETVLMRLLRGSGLAGLAGMGRDVAPVQQMADARAPRGVTPMRLIRPFLDVPKARLVATLDHAGVDYASDPSNADPRFTRVRLRSLMGELAGEGLSAPRLALLARRLGRASRALDAAVADAEFVLTIARNATRQTVATVGFLALSEEIGLRLAARLIGRIGGEGTVELAKLESLYAALIVAMRPVGRGRTRKPAQSLAFRRTLAGAMITVTAVALVIERAPPRRPVTRKAGAKSGPKSVGKTARKA